MRHQFYLSQVKVLILLPLFSVLLVACDRAVVHEDLRVEDGVTTVGPRKPGVFGEGGLFSLGGGPPPPAGMGSGIGVNAYLWRASLDTISVWPVTSADPFGGVIITDWYAPEGNSDERFKMNVYILDRTLRADGIRVAVFRQVRDKRIGWRDAPVKSSTSSRVEDAILTRARQFRRADSAQN